MRRFPLLVDEIHLRGVVLAVPDDRSDGLAGSGRIPNAPEGVVVDDRLDEGVRRLSISSRDGEVPDRHLVHASRKQQPLYSRGIFSDLGSCTGEYKVLTSTDPTIRDRPGIPHGYF